MSNTWYAWDMTDAINDRYEESRKAHEAAVRLNERGAHTASLALLFESERLRKEARKIQVRNERMRQKLGERNNN